MMTQNQEIQTKSLVGMVQCPQAFQSRGLQLELGKRQSSPSKKVYPRRKNPSFYSSWGRIQNFWLFLTPNDGEYNQCRGETDPFLFLLEQKEAKKARFWAQFPGPAVCSCPWCSQEGAEGLFSCRFQPGDEARGTRCLPGHHGSGVPGSARHRHRFRR